MRCGPGQYVVITDENGGIINDPVLIRLEKNKFWLSLANSHTLLWAKGVAVHAGLDADIIEPDVSPLQVQGPKAKEVMKGLGSRLKVATPAGECDATVLKKPFVDPKKDIPKS